MQLEAPWPHGCCGEIGVSLLRAAGAGSQPQPLLFPLVRDLFKVKK